MYKISPFYRRRGLTIGNCSCGIGNEVFNAIVLFMPFPSSRKLCTVAVNSVTNFVGLFLFFGRKKCLPGYFRGHVRTLSRNGDPRNVRGCEEKYAVETWRQTFPNKVASFRLLKKAQKWVGC